jgi:Mrp family chromosome partitioning ATPase
MSKRFDLLDKSGFVESLSRKAAGKLPVFPTKTSGLDIMPAGRCSNDGVASEGIANGAVKTCIGQLFEQYSYDIILLDSPPVLPVADAAILAGQVDGTILVEREHVSRRSAVADALIRLGSAGGRLLGTVFVGSDVHQDYRYAYGYSYGKTRGS